MADYPFLFSKEKEVDACLDEFEREPARELVQEFEHRHVNIYLSKAWRNDWYGKSWQKLL
jgi:hypothetical protein